MRIERYPRVFASFLLALVATAPFLRAEEQGKVTHDRWYVMMIEDQRAGWMHEWTTESGDAIDTRSEANMKIKRGAIEVPIVISTRWVESKDGTPKMAMTTQNMSIMKIEQVMLFDGEKIKLMSRQGNQVKNSEVPMPEEPWFTPSASSREFERQRAEGKDVIELATIDPSYGAQVITSKMTFKKKEAVEVFGKTVPAELWEVEMSIMPGVKTVVHTDEQGRPIKSVTDIAGMKMTILAADKETATAKIDAPEILANTFVTVDKPIQNPRALRKAVFKLTRNDDEKINLPTAGAQKAEQMDDGSLKLTIDLDASFDLAEDKPTDDHTAATMYLDHESEKIKALAEKWLKDKQHLSDAAKAEVLREGVYHYVNKKSLGVGFATASEVAETRQGDCSEHGVLLAAVLRAAGIPSRTVTGLVYADNFLGRRDIFGYHMWTQAWIETENGGQWLDLDGTLSSKHAFDATHIAMSHSSMKDGETFNDIVQLTPLFGRLKVEVIDN